ncbi:MAG TPA: pitrilysin family protein [Gemmatimonadaceae bacterium]|nr:pitrilysin family protein [Gemmatimonadaceae bacterium]
MRRILPALAIAALAASPVLAQAGRSSFDRKALPKPGADPVAKIPTWTKVTLSNGAQLIVVERRTLPLISFTMSFVGGANQIEPADKPGLGSITASMMTEGTTLRSGDDISNALQLLGTTVGFGIGGEGGSISFRSLKDKFEPTLAIMAEELLQPAFPAPALDRLKQRTIVNLRLNLDRTSGIAGVVYPKLLYTTDHPYGRTMNEQSVSSITRDDVVAFHRAFYQPSRAIITVVGDITPAEAKTRVEKALAAWPAGGTPATFNYPPPPAGKPTTIYIVDKPGAAQSTFSLGLVGPPRDTPDYYALRVMNNLFGEQFQSRLNANIREAKGWSYGVGANFAYGRGPGPFRAGGEIQTDKTDSALVEFMKEIKGIRGDRMVTDDELASAKAALIQSLPSRLASLAGISGMINEIYLNGLPEDYWTRFQDGVKAVTAADVQRVARQYIDADRLAILIVGDRARIEGPVKATNIAPVVILDAKGNPIG